MYTSNCVDWPKWGFDSAAFHKRLEAIKLPLVYLSNSKMLYRNYKDIFMIIIDHNNVKNMLQAHEMLTIANRYKVRAPMKYHQFTQKLEDAISEAESNYTMFLLSNESGS